MAEAHRCEGHTPNAEYGAAVTSCFEDDAGRFWVSNDEYSSHVAFCPYCGARGPVAPEVEPEAAMLARMRGHPTPKADPDGSAAADLAADLIHSDFDCPNELEETPDD